MKTRDPETYAIIPRSHAPAWECIRSLVNG